MKIKIKQLHKDAVIPTYHTHGSSGFDLHALEDVKLLPGETKLVKTGLAMEVPYEYEVQIRPRSGISLKTPLRVANSPGTVDSDYRGEVCVVMQNTSRAWRWPWTKGLLIKKGDRVAQGVICNVYRPHMVVTTVDNLTETDRGDGGFGSTDK